MPLSVTVEASENFPNDEAVTLAKLRKGAKPSVAITGSVGGVDIEAAAVSNTAIASDAAIALTKLEGQTDNHILLVGDTSDTAGNSPATKFITAAEGYEGAAIELEGSKAKITPSKETITADKLSKDDDDNVIFGLTEDTSYTAATDDYVMVHDTDATTETRLKKVKLATMQKVGSTEYTRKDLALNDGVAETTTDNYQVTVDMGGAAFQTVNTLTNGKTYTFVIKSGTMPGSGTVRTVSIRLTGPSTSTASFGWNDSWQWPEMSGNDGPTTIAKKTALLSITAFGSQQSDVVAAYVETVTDTNA
ncbi:hypothetical protein CMI37_21055 [Candidatus Pacearchaeota archaeon]|nr:hypothetical protein [Candidatus Pacearchaeota archaeon]